MTYTQAIIQTQTFGNVITPCWVDLTISTRIYGRTQFVPQQPSCFQTPKEVTSAVLNALPISKMLVEFRNYQSSV